MRGSPKLKRQSFPTPVVARPRGNEMYDRDVILERPGDTGAQVTVSCSDVREGPVRLRLLGYDACEFESDHLFVPGGQVSIHIYRMWCISARYTYHVSRVVE